MNVYRDISDIIEAIVNASDDMAELIDTSDPAWIDVGAPLASSDSLSVSPCVRLVE